MICPFCDKRREGEWYETKVTIISKLCDSVIHRENRRLGFKR